MAKNNAIGHTDCHVCGFADAEIKLDKTGKAYLFCPDCNIQSFTRNQTQSDKLIAKMRPVEISQSIPVADVEKLKKAILTPVTVTEKVTVQNEQIEEVTPPPIPQKQAEKKGFSLGDL